MRLRLPPTLHLATVGEDVVLLDTAAGGYSCLPAAAFALGMEPASDELEVTEPHVAEALKAAGAVEVDGAPSASARRAPPSLPSRGAETFGVRPSLGEVSAFAGALCDAAFGYAGRSFATLLWSGARRGRRRILPRDEAALVRAAAVFEQLMLWTPGAEKCLYRAFLLRRFLARQGRPADWVFGVQTWPFTAHCWLQAGDLALDEQPERLAAFTPILVV